MTKAVKKVAKAAGVLLVGLFIAYAAVERPDSFKGAVVGFVADVGGAAVNVWHWVGQYF